MRSAAALIAAVVCATAISAQQPGRIATTTEALLGSAVFFHGRNIVVKQKLITERGGTRLAESAKPIYVFWKDRPSGDEGEVRGEFFDLGRIEPRDSRFTGYDLTQLVEIVNRGQWPARDQIYVLVNASLLPSSPPKGPTVRTVSLSPNDYVDREVKVIGRFKGRNLYGDLPFALAKGKWDFVIQSAEGAVWVTGVRPKGNGFDLDPSKRVDTGRWVEVTGVVKMQGATPYIEATGIELAAAPEDAPVTVSLPERPPEPPPSVIFSAPIQDDQGADRTAPVRIQFSRDIDPKSIRDRVRVGYVNPTAASRVPQVTVTYNDAVHAIEIKFAQPLDAFQQVKVELLEGITALDGQTLKPWTLTFTTGR